MVVGGADGRHWIRVVFCLNVHEVLEHSYHPAEVVAVADVQRVALLDVEAQVAKRHCRQGVAVLIVGEKLHDAVFPVEVVADAIVGAKLLICLVVHLAVEKRLVDCNERVFYTR